MIRKDLGGGGGGGGKCTQKVRDCKIIVLKKKLVTEKSFEKPEHEILKEYWEILQFSKFLSNSVFAELYVRDLI